MLTESEDDYSRLLFNNTSATTKNWAIAGRSMQQTEIHDLISGTGTVRQVKILCQLEEAGL